MPPPVRPAGASSVPGDSPSPRGRGPFWNTCMEPHNHQKPPGKNRMNRARPVQTAHEKTSLSTLVCNLLSLWGSCMYACTTPPPRMCGELYAQPKTRNPKPETRNPKPETRNPKPENRNPKPETQRSFECTAAKSRTAGLWRMANVTAGPGLMF